MIIAPIGGGSGAPGPAWPRGRSTQRCVSSARIEASPAAYLSWQQHAMIEAPNRTVAEGLPTGSAFDAAAYLVAAPG
ncbi:hypothetical protein [Candidatus Amarolinea aalborgensis]|uniref:hypothetical protein n=1 Tax=Candidatus Amarolinea aalborgensis TaxID=2249329 RepID=UPI003BFA23E8